MQPPQSIEEIKAGLETTEKGGVRQSIRNCLTVFQRDPLLSGAIAYNILTDRKDIIKPVGFHRESTALNDTDMKYSFPYVASWASGKEMKELKDSMDTIRLTAADFLEKLEAAVAERSVERMTAMQYAEKFTMPIASK